MYLFFMLQFMFLVFIVARSMHQQGHQVPAKLEKHTLLLLKKYTLHTHCYQYSTKGRLSYYGSHLM